MHAASFLFLGTRNGDQKLVRRTARVRKHRPLTANAVYKLVRPDGHYVTDEDFEAVGNCARCFPRRRKPMIDRRRG